VRVIGSGSLSLGPLGIVRSTLLSRWPSVDTIRHFGPTLSENTLLRKPGLVVADREHRVLDLLAQHRALDGGVARLAVVRHL
jgi:hypothetical protein